MRWRSHLLLAVLVTGCVWRGYDRVLSIHLDVLAGMADKMVSIAEVGRRPTSNDMTEMLYPLERGRLFLRQYERRAGEDSYRQFAQLLDRYAALAAAIDDARTDDGRWARLRPRLPDEARDLRQRVAAIRTALAGTA
jgi:hypothetical protein